ncbi:MAG: rhamnulokinase family protein [Verrucomicrobiota bacterium]
MDTKNVYIAVDLGAGSGRVLAGEFDDNRIDLKELHRFENTPLQLATGFHWDFDTLFKNILTGLKTAAKAYGSRVKSIGIDTWGVDYGLLDETGKLVNLPFQYRDARTDDMMKLAFENMPKRDIYEATGIQFMFFNTLYQLLAEVRSEHSKIDSAQNLLFMPDLIGYMLTGKKTQERTIASTSQLYNPRTRSWDASIVKSMGLPSRWFGELSDPGTILGPLTETIAAQTGLKDVVVVSVAGHDTASAVAGVPSQEENPIFLSSGTWSLMGIQLKQPVIEKNTFIDDFTNEVGVDNSVRFLKNICGLWLIQESRRAWLEQGEDIPYHAMSKLASEAQPFRSLINPDDPSFTSSGDMPRRVQEYCWNTRQQIPETKGQTIRCIYESLALRYSSVWNKLLQHSGSETPILHIVGGGSQDALLNQFTANAIGSTVLAGPTEATGLGNIIVQMLAGKQIGSIAEGRQIIASMSDLKSYQPSDTDVWSQARETFNSIQTIHPDL